MKKITLLLSSGLLVVGSIFAQENVSPSDNPNNLVHNPKKATTPYTGNTSNNKMACAPASTSDTTVCDSAIVTLSATGGDMIIWYDSLTGGTALDTNASFTTPMLNTTTSYYAEAVCIDTTMMGISTQTSVYSGIETRGYWFVAPTDFIITGVRVPTDASSGDQSIQVLKFNTVPPTYPSLTNDFTSLGLWQAVPGTNIINTFIPITTNDTIGVLGSRAAKCSYVNGFTTTINGFNVDLTRLGFQQDLATSAANDVFSGTPGGSISRVELYYSISDPAPRTSATVTVTSCTGINDVAFEKFISVYPNPSSGNVWIKNTSKKEIEINLFDVLGKNISTMASSQSSEKINVSNLANGTYYIQIINNNESLVKKIIVNK